MRKFPKVVRLDSSDLRVFPRAAERGEWAVPGSFAWADRDIAALERKDRLAFAHGWLGTESFGFAALVEVAEMPEETFFQVVERLAAHFVERYGAPGLAEALPAARAEADYAVSLCDQEVHRLMAIEREEGPEGLKERVRTLRPERAGEHARIWTIEAQDGGGDDPGDGR